MSAAIAFVSYAHQDHLWLGRIEAHLRPLEDQGLIRLFIDRRIDAGTKWNAQIEQALRDARFAIVLVSADFFASTFIKNIELPRLLEAAAQGRTDLLTIHLSRSQYARSPLGSYQAINDPRAVLHALDHADQEDVFGKLAEKIYAVLGASPAAPALAPAPGTATQPPPAVPAPAPAELSSESAQLRQQISDFNTYKALHDALHDLQSPINVVLSDPSFGNAKTEIPEALRYLVDDLSGLVERALEVAGAPLLESELSTCQERLRRARDALATAVTQQSRGALNEAVGALQRVLGQDFSLVNDRLVRIARRVQVADLARGFARSRTGAETAALERLLARSVELQKRLDALAWEHDQWQAVENELRAALSQPDDPIAAMTRHWPELEPPLLRILPPQLDSLWAVKLSETRDALKAAMNEADAPKARRLLRDMSRGAAHRFMIVDKDLLAAGGDLRQLGEILDAFTRTGHASA